MVKKPVTATQVLKWWKKYGELKLKVCYTEERNKNEWPDRERKLYAKGEVLCKYRLIGDGNSWSFSCFIPENKLWWVTRDRRRIVSAMFAYDKKWKMRIFQVQTPCGKILYKRAKCRTSSK
jgi:hypothetical protein